MGKVFRIRSMPRLEASSAREPQLKGGSQRGHKEAEERPLLEDITKQSAEDRD
jgi:hypothetical protein